jgi:hypothetical protein
MIFPSGKNLESNLWGLVIHRLRDFMADKEAHSYSMEDVFTNVNKILKIFKEEKIDPAVFLHSIIFASELMIKNYRFVPKDVAEIRRQSRKIVDDLNKMPPKAPK